MKSSPVPESHTKDFAYWSLLAQKDPEQFEIERKMAIDEVISCAPEDRQDNLLRLQWRIDMVRARASNPLSACIQLNRMLWDHMTGAKGLFTLPTLFREIGSCVEDTRRDLQGIPRLNSQPFTIVDGESRRVDNDVSAPSALVIPLFGKK